jgi:uncharacterized protein (TIGR01244 family)
MRPTLPVWTILAAVLAVGASARSEAPTTPAPAPVTEELRVAIPNARMPLEGVLTGGQPTAADLAEAAALGYHTVIDLLPPGESGVAEEAAQVPKLGMRYVSIPVAGAQDLTDQNVEALAKALADPAAYPVLLHCSSGNRAGALLALKAFRLDGKSAAEALELGVRAGLTKLEPEVRKKLGL